VLQTWLQNYHLYLAFDDHVEENLREHIIQSQLTQLDLVPDF